ncbi:hypothetical protein EON66_02850 [archaeon]|nr:MAG: hypothetical protein EON66_02850 [archaeon]
MCAAAGVACREEKERLSTLYEEERKRNLENESKVRSVMQTIKEDNIELMKRMRTLMNDRTKLTKRFKKLKDQHLATRDALAGEMARYQELYADGGEEGPHRDELEAILENVESLHSQVCVCARAHTLSLRAEVTNAAVCTMQVEAEAEELKSIKDEIADNEQQQMEARSEAAAQRMLLEEDAELRKAIQVCCARCFCPTGCARVCARTRARHRCALLLGVGCRCPCS